MDIDTGKLIKALEDKSKRSKNYKKGSTLIQQIIADFDTIEKEINYIISKEFYLELIKRNSKSFENNSIRGLNKEQFYFDYIKEINKQSVLQEYKKRNLIKWEKIIRFGFESMGLIAWGVAFRRKAFPVFLDESELKKYGYGSGLDKPYDYQKLYGDNKYYDKEVYPPTDFSYDKKWSEIILTKGMRAQLIYLYDLLFEKKIKEKKLKEEEKDNLLIPLYRNPQLLEVIFESVKEFEKSNIDKINESESKLLIIYENLNSEKKKEMRKNFKIIKEIKSRYKSTGYYSDVYIHANSERKNGKTLDEGLKSGILKYKKTNSFLADLIIRHNNDLESVIIYLHSSYYHTKYKLLRY